VRARERKKRGQSSGSILKKIRERERESTKQKRGKFLPLANRISPALFCGPSFPLDAAAAARFSASSACFFCTRVDDDNKRERESSLRASVRERERERKRVREKRAEMRFENGEKRQNETKTNLCGYQFNHLSLSLSLRDARANCATALSYCSLSLHASNARVLRCCVVRFVSRLRSTRITENRERLGFRAFG
jgi:hypothetical protein